MYLFYEIDQVRFQKMEQFMFNSIFSEKIDQNESGHKFYENIYINMESS